ncbi:MAG: Fur family transcriptional regulator [Syntrophomonadaceae bacterium]
MVDEQLKKLQRNGLKITPQRKLILDILEEFSQLTGEEIASLARDKQPSISTGTVYRNLKLLSELGLIRNVASIDGIRRFENASVHSHHLVCLRCKNTVEIDFCPMNNELQKLAEKYGFQIADHDFQIRGYCMECKKGA